jgi:hypothetical protein
MRYRVHLLPNMHIIVSKSKRMRWLEYVAYGYKILAGKLEKDQLEDPH